MVGMDWSSCSAQILEILYDNRPLIPYLCYEDSAKWWLTIQQTKQAINEDDFSWHPKF